MSAIARVNPEGWAEALRLELIEDVGRAAFYRGASRDSNPYTAEDERHAWEVGWLLGTFLDTGEAGL